MQYKDSKYNVYKLQT